MVSHGSTLDGHLALLVETAVKRALEPVLADIAGGQARSPLLDRAGLARELCISLGTLDALRRRGLPTVWVMETPRFEWSAVLAWLKVQAPAAGQDASSGGDEGGWHGAA